MSGAMSEPLLDIEKIVTSRLEAARARIVAAMDEQGVTASGRTAASLQVRKTDGGVQLVSVAGDHAPMPTTEVGRDGGKVPYRFTDLLVEWTRDKGLQFNSDRERRTFAYLLGQRIAREGTLRHKFPIDVYTTASAETAEAVKRDLYHYLKDVIINANRN